jgi:hypothetical protein
VRRAAALTLAALLLIAAAPARAEEVTAAELRRRAAQAADDPAALERLRGVDRVEGRPMDVRSALRGADADEAAERLAQLEPSSDAGAADGPRDRAKEVLSSRRYKGTDVPRPFTGALQWLGERLRPITDAAEDAFDAVASRFPGGRLGVWLLLVVVVVALAALIGRQAIRRRAAPSRAPAARAAEVERPRDLERAADAAEDAGRWEEAVRLRFRAGLLRLDERQVLEYRDSLTTGEVADVLRMEPFERLGTRFDAIAYGGRDAGPDDAGAARADWAEVLSGAGRR